MMKYLYQKYTLRYVTLLCAAFGLLTWAGCSNVFTPPPPHENGLKITISSDMENQRTLYPHASFTKYVLSFSGPAAHEDITVQDGQTAVTVNDLAAGQWTITAVGYVTIDGTEYPAAQGSAQITVAAGSFQTITIPISASRAGDDGFFSYSVSYPEALADTARLSVHQGRYYGFQGTVFDLSQNPSDTISLAPGYYTISIQLYNDNYSAGRVEVVHIYSNMETKAEYAFVESDFARTITLSGTAVITVDGEPMEEGGGVAITAYRDAEYSDRVADAWTMRWEGYAWSMKIAPFDTETLLYFKVRIWFPNGEIERELGSVTVKDQNIPGIDLDYDFAGVTLSGTATVTVNGAAPQSDSTVRVYAYRNADYSGNSVASALVDLQDNTWSMTMLSFDTDTPLYLQVGIQIPNSYTNYRKNIDTSVTVKDQSISGIDLGAINLQIINVSGTAAVTLNGSAMPLRSNAYVMVYRDAGYSSNAYPGATVNPQDNTWSAGNVWSFDTTLYFSVIIGTYNGSVEKRTNVTVTMGNQDISGIDLGAVDFDLIFLSGTAAVTVGGVPLPDGNNSVSVTAYRDAAYSDRVGMAWTNPGEGNVWSMVFEPFDADTPLYFTVRIWLRGSEVERGVGSVTVKDHHKPDTNFDYDIAGLTLSGTAAVTVNEVTPDSGYSVYVEAYRNADYSGSAVASVAVDLQNNTWSMTMLAFDTDTSLYLQVYIHIPYPYASYRKNIDVPVTAKDQNIPNIDLGAVNLQIINVSGTVNVTVNGSAPPPDGYFRVRVYPYFDTVVNLQDNTWSVNNVWSFDTDVSLDISVYFRAIEKRTNVSVTMENQDISGIDLGTVNFNVITLSGTAVVTVNGENANFIHLRAYRDAGYSDSISETMVMVPEGNTWSMTLESFDTETPLYFIAECYTNSGGMSTRELGTPVTAKNQDITGIAIAGDFD